jgi:type II general secretion pathway (GSP) F protein
MKRIDDNDKSAFFEELGMLLDAGLDFSRAFSLLISGSTGRAMRDLLQTLYDDVVGGMSLAGAMMRSETFSTLDSGVVRIGEQTGRLQEALGFLHDYYREQSAQRKMISSAVSYPIVILCVAVAVVAFMLAVIVPMFEQVYSRMGGELPTVTQWVVAVSRSFPDFAMRTTVVAAVAGIAYWRFRKTETIRAATATVLLHIPVVGNILRRHYQTQFCKLLYLLTSSGIQLTDAMDELLNVIEFYPYNRSFTEIRNDIERGRSLADSISAYGSLYDKRLAAMLRVGEETNRLPEMLHNRGQALSEELKYGIRKLGTVLEPILILLVGILVAVILIAMYMPMFALGGVMG